MDKKFIFMIYGIYLALVCVISGIWSATTIVDMMTTGLDIFWPPQIAEESMKYHVPASGRDVVEGLLHLIIAVPVFIWHMKMLRKEIKTK